MTFERRWDNDATGIGIRDASIAAPDVERLRAVLDRAGWVAEAPEHHLLPHVVEAAKRSGVQVVRAEVVGGVLEIEVSAAGASRREVRAAVYGLIGAFAEASTHVRETDGAFQVVTGMLPGDGEFATHGHLARIRAVSVPAGE